MRGYLDEEVPREKKTPEEKSGIRYSRETAYIPCFEEGDVLTTWQARNQEVLDACAPGSINSILRSRP